MNKTKSNKSNSVSKAQNNSLKYMNQEKTNNLYSSQKSTLNFKEQNITSLNTKKRRMQSANKDANDKTKLSIIKTKIEEIYKQYHLNLNNYNKANISNSNWKLKFQELFEKEKCIDFKTEFLLPRSIDERGSYILTLEKFWILHIEIIKSKLTLDQLITTFNNALTYVANSSLLIDQFNMLIQELKFNKKDISKYSLENKIDFPSNLDNKDFSFLLKINSGSISSNIHSKKSKSKLANKDNNSLKENGIKINLNNIPEISATKDLDNLIDEKDFNAAKEESNYKEKNKENISILIFTLIIF